MKATNFEDVKRALEIQKIFLRYLHREPEEEAWVHYYNSDNSIDVVRQIILGSEEFQLKHATREAGSMWAPFQIAPWIVVAPTPQLGWEPIIRADGLNLVLDLSTSKDPMRTISFDAYLSLPLEENIQPPGWSIDLCLRFIRQAHLSGSKVLICSDKGLIRAPCIGCLYLSVIHNKPFRKVVDEVQRVHATFIWNKAFLSEGYTAETILKYNKGGF